MRNNIKNVFYLIVFAWFSCANAGSYDDFFNAIQQDDPGVVRALLARGFDPNTVNPKGEYALVQAVRQPSFKVLEVLLQSPAIKVEVRTAADESPLMLAALKGYLPLCQSLIAHDADVNKPGWAPLHYAATGGQVAVMRLLLDNNAYIDAASPNGTTPLMMAAMYGTAEAVKLLLDAGADPLLKNAKGVTAIDFARQAQKEAVVDLIAAAIRGRAQKGSW
jgi:ankyrin repeat protein